MPEKIQSTPATVAVVIPCFRQGRFLAGAIESAIAQSIAPDEIIVVDDGGDEDLAKITARFPPVTLIRQKNQGLAAARNTGLHAARSNKIIFLDADDRLCPNAVQAGLQCFRENPEAGFVYGAFLEVRGMEEARCFTRAACRADLVRLNCVGMIAAAMFDRLVLLAHGGFDETLGMCEDWDTYLRLARAHPFAAHDTVVARYVRHGGNMSNDVARIRRWVEVVRRKERGRGLRPEELQAWRQGPEAWDAFYPGNSPWHLLKRAYRKTKRKLRPHRSGALTEPRAPRR